MQAQVPPVNEPAVDVVVTVEVEPEALHKLMDNYDEAAMKMTELARPDSRLEAEILESCPNDEEEVKHGPPMVIENMSQSEMAEPKEESEPKIIFDMLNDDTIKNAAARTAVNYFHQPLDPVENDQRHEHMSAGERRDTSFDYVPTMMDGGRENVAQMMMVGGDEDSEVIGEVSGDFSESQARESVQTKENGINFH